MAEYVVEFGRDGRRVEPDGRLDAAAFHRNHQPIWAVLARLLDGRSGDVLEAGSGTGQHVVHFATQRPDLIWWPSDLNDNHLASIAAWRKHSGLSNIRDARRIDLSDPAWVAGFTAAGGPAELTAIFCANVIHIAPWPVAEGLFAGAGQVLSQGGLLVLYGPFKRDGKHTAVSNAVFDTSLREGNPDWGVRDITDLEALASRNGLVLRETVEMPANNMILVFARGA
ncbi:class I SAM-dependent methyltransferase [Bradyrhizobium sp. SRS-191]|uniref:class I SAM-dependent methyltransferase n=1 Tax=Bradyrhizobium sp. SRS-191 TaxID=2962606 RepID=UPI00211DE3BC|nr:class I SAM-dependent methyltransferase [Bradyrhizobium sp. SRS-191]